MSLLRDGADRGGRNGLEETSRQSGDGEKVDARAIHVETLMLEFVHEGSVGPTHDKLSAERRFDLA